MPDKPMMKCGHAANGTTTLTNGEAIVCCAICAGIHPGAYTRAETPPDLTGRKARCSYDNGKAHVGHNGHRAVSGLVPSSPNLAFFEYRPTSSEDRYYCGCWGWD